MNRPEPASALAAGTSASGDTGAAPRVGLVLLLSSAATFLAVLDTTVVNIAFPDLHRSFTNASVALLTWVVTAYAVPFAALLAPAGRVADVVGRRLLFLGSVGLFAVASALCAAAANLPTLIGARALQGAAAAGMMPAALSLVLALVPPAQRMTSIGLVGAAGSVAAAVGPTLGGLLVDAWGWRSVFLINLPLGLLILLGALLGLPRDVRSGESLPDPIGVLGITCGVGCVALGVTQGSDWGWRSVSVLGLIGIGLPLTVVSLARARRHPAPAIDVTLWRNRTFTATNVTAFFFGAAMYAYLLSAILYLTVVWQYSEIKAGLAVTPGAFTAAVAALAVGRLVPSGRQWIATVLGALVFAASVAGMYLLLGDSPAFLAVWLPAGLVGGVGIGATLTGLSVVASVSLPPHRFAAGSGLLMAARQVGGAVGIAGLGAILAAGHGMTTGGLLSVFLACAICGSVAALSALFLRPRRQ
ncbi:MFS transporter [Micromonospora sp. NPDC005215]|uniref:MFS transporter n=1 Tax=Micromonospora sp. NPDC005215 TaxID=3157024 RepID=UPI0033BF9A59